MKKQQRWLAEMDEIVLSLYAKEMGALGPLYEDLLPVDGLRVLAAVGCTTVRVVRVRWTGWMWSNFPMADQLDLSVGMLGYVREVSLREDDVLRELREETALLPGGVLMQVMPEEGQLLGLLVGLCGASTVLEVGTFTGYSTLCMARALPAGGRVITCDISGKWPMIGAEFWQRAGVAERIDVRIGDAGATLAGLVDQQGPGSVDLVFIDADKGGYVRYYEAALELVRPGGLIVLDNTLFLGRVIDPDAQDPDTVAVRELNALLAGDDRVDLSMLPMADGITLVRKKM